MPNQLTVFLVTIEVLLWVFGGGGGYTVWVWGDGRHQEAEVAVADCCDRVCVWGGDGRCQEAEVAVADCCDRVCVCVWGVMEDAKRLKLLLLTVVTGCVGGRGWAAGG